MDTELNQTTGEIKCLNSALTSMIWKDDGGCLMSYDFNCQCGCSWDSSNPWLRTDQCYKCGEVIEAGEKKEQEDEETLV